MQKLIPPRLFVICVLLALALRTVCPVPAPDEGGGVWIGAAAFALGFSLLFAGWRRFRNARTEIHTFERPGQLIVSGPYRWSRNPMYLGFLVMLLGVSAMLVSPCAYLAPLVFFVAASTWYIPTEERNCELAFGQAYREYRSTTRRWL